MVSKDVLAIHGFFPSSNPEFDPNHMTFEILRPPDIKSLTDCVMDKIQLDGYQPDIVIGLKRGGYIPAKTIAQLCGVKVFYPRMRFYDGVDKHTHKPVITDKLPNNLKLKGSNVLLVDDVNDTSASIQAGLEYLRDEHDADIIKTAVLHEKPSRRVLTADFVARFTDAWIVYPWEYLGSDMHEKGEFFLEQFPVWMLPDNVKSFETFSDCVKRAHLIGFHIGEIPSLENSDFKNHLVKNLITRAKELKIAFDRDSFAKGLVEILQ